MGGREALARFRGQASQEDAVKAHTKILVLHLKERYGFRNLTEEVQRAVDESGVKEGMALVNPMHITASVFMNDDESGLHRDFLRWLEELAPHKPGLAYDHHRTGEDNADAHLKRQIMGREVVVAITAGCLYLGTWEQIFYGEFDGQRDKRVLMKVVGI